MLDSLRLQLAALIAPELVEQRDRATRLAEIDALTGIANRRAFDRALPSAESDPDKVVILFDANNFGKLNKAEGHKVGDAILRDIADVMIRCAMDHGLSSRVFRIGGDEFAILSPSNVSTTLRDSIEQAFDVRGISAACTVSLSGTIGPTLELADAQLQARKHERKRNEPQVRNYSVKQETMDRCKTTARGRQRRSSYDSDLLVVLQPVRCVHDRRQSY